MKYVKSNLVSENNNNIYKNYSPMFRRLYKDYAYLNLDETIFKNMILNEIELSKNEYNNEIAYSIYLREKITRKINAYINDYYDNDSKKLDLINIFINYHFQNFTTPDYAIFQLIKLDEFLSNIDYVPNPDMIIELINRNQLLRKAIIMYLDNQSNDMKYFKNALSTNSIVTSIIDIYCELNHIDSKSNTIDKIFNMGNENNTDMDTDAVRYYFNEIKNIPPLTIKEEEKYGYLILENNLQARNILIERNLKLVISIAKKYARLGVPFIDLIQDGNEGLIIAANKFDIRKGFRFSTYAAWWIRHTILTAIENNRSAIRLPIENCVELMMYKRELFDLTNELERIPTDEEMANRLNVSTDKIREIKQTDIAIVSLNDLINNESKNENYELYAIDEESLENITINHDLKDAMINLLEACKLLSREIEVIMHRYGLYDDKPKTLPEIAEILGGISRERVRQIEAKAIKKIRVSQYIKEYAIYMDNYDEALRRIYNYRAEYSKNQGNSFKLSFDEGNNTPKVYNKVTKPKRKYK